jgi:ubiquinone/menaquinone biosynthesis C-methylase UbiE
MAPSRGHSDFQSLYYECDRFWNPATTNLGEADQLRAEAALSCLPSDCRSVLDIGCGNGVFANTALAGDHKLFVLGVDRSTAALQYVRSSRVLGDVASLPCAGGSFDCVVALEVLEHLPMPTYWSALRELTRVARKYAVVTVPRAQDLREGQTRCPACATLFHPDLHLRSFDEQSLRVLLRSFGFRCTGVTEVGSMTRLRWLGPYLRRRPATLSLPMASPVCPVCGATNDGFLAPRGPLDLTPASAKVSLWRRAKASLRAAWPREEHPRWLMATYARV